MNVVVLQTWGMKQHMQRLIGPKQLGDDEEEAEPFLHLYTDQALAGVKLAGRLW